MLSERAEKRSAERAVGAGSGPGERPGGRSGIVRASRASKYKKVVHRLCSDVR